MCFFFSSRRRHTRLQGDWSSDVCSSDLRVETAALLEDWARIVRKVGAVPVRWEYEKAGTYSSECFDKRFQGWMKVPAAFTRAVDAGALAGDWADVLEKIHHGPIPTKGG